MNLENVVRACAVYLIGENFNIVESVSIFPPYFCVDFPGNVENGRIYDNLRKLY